MITAPQITFVNMIEYIDVGLSSSRQEMAANRERLPHTVSREDLTEPVPTKDSAETANPAANIMLQRSAKWCVLAHEPAIPGMSEACPKTRFPCRNRRNGSTVAERSSARRDRLERVYRMVATDQVNSCGHLLQCGTLSAPASGRTASRSAAGVKLMG